MNEFEIYHIAQLNFINNAIYTVAVVLMTAISFYLIRRARELDFPTYGKAILSVFCACTVFFGLQVSAYLVLNQKNTSFQLSELKQSGVEISSLGESFITFWGHTYADGPATLAPDLPSIILWGTIAVMLFVGLWGKAPDGAYKK
ncbi:MAG: hypothetical protein ACPH63_08030 [Flavobacteriaceae bacterium]